MSEREPVGEWKDKSGKPVGPIPIACYCGWSGDASELVTDWDTEDNDLRCPICETSGWTFQ